MNDADQDDLPYPPLSLRRQIVQICDRFEAAWRAGRRIEIEIVLGEVSPLDRPYLLTIILALELDLRRRAGEQPTQSEYLRRFPDHVDAIASAFAVKSFTIESQKLDSHAQPRAEPLRIQESNEGADKSGSRQSASQPAPLPERIGRYRIDCHLGEGGFGIVYRGYDEQLQRSVAVKVPHEHLKAAGTIDAYLDEARIVARLEHPNIVPVYDVGSNEQFPCFVVSKFVEGGDLGHRLRQSRLSWREAAELCAAIADGLHYAHKRGLVHRDIKPGNILLDTAGKPFIGDFGLALREKDIGLGPRHAGTPQYMSPEQARGEGHRVDGRSDIFSLGIVLYQALTGQRPFKSDSIEELLRQICSMDAPPPRQTNDGIPRELERICLKALSKRATERYTTAKDMAEDLRSLLEGSPATDKRPAPPIVEPGQPPETLPPSPKSTPTSSKALPRIVPKGLRSFGAEDADFFLELLAGPRDRDGLPDSIRFWKTRIEETDPDDTFRVGLVYGPSGCGKSSLFKAGLLPRLSPDVLTVYVEATPDDTETRLLKGIRKHCPALSHTLNLRESLTALRRGEALPAAGKVLIVLDQFEQWLHAHADRGDTELVQALRQCDGGRVQCIVMVRDDFWLAVSRFMRDLEIDLVPGRNIALVDLFDLDHARRVLAAFGQALGKLPEQWKEATKGHKEFLKQAIAGLAQGNKVICVRLALFAEMMKGRPWAPATLREVGGAEGIGVAFLEDTFSSPSANPTHRLHQKAARAVLKALLPEAGTDIKGNMRSRDDLLQASGYSTHPRDFDELIRILDSELRLVTPTDPEGSDESIPTDAIAGRHYQLAHDYLVPSLRDWLTRKQKETHRGRAELRLAERTALWSDKPEKRHLPSLSEWARIRLFARRHDWSNTQRKMMRQADWHHVARGLAMLATILVIGFGLLEYQARVRAQELREHLLRDEMIQLPAIVSEIELHGGRVRPLLREALAAETNPNRQLRLRLALVRADLQQALDGEDLLNAKPEEFEIIRRILDSRKEQLIDPLWRAFNDEHEAANRRFRAACALVVYAPKDSHWDRAAEVVVDGIVAESPFVMGRWYEALEPVRQQLIPPLAASLETRAPSEHQAIIDFYRRLAGDETVNFKPLEDRLSADRTGLSDLEKAKRKATIAAALVALGKPDQVWPLLVQSPNPTFRSFLIERLRTSGATLSQIQNRLGQETDIWARRALILVLGAFPADAASKDLIEYLTELYRNDEDAGVHSAVGWVLHRWNRQAKTDEIDRLVTSDEPFGGRRWYVNRQGLTFSVIEGPGQLVPGKTSGTHRFAIATTDVTTEQYKAFDKNYEIRENDAAFVGLPVSRVTWYDAARFCNYLTDNASSKRLVPCYKPIDLEFDADYQSRDGYRLPAETEWEFACRAGAVTNWHFGDADDELASCYAWWLGNAHRDGVRRRFPVGLLKPNDFGLFDMLGNVHEFCQVAVKSTFFSPNDIVTDCRGGSYLLGYANTSCTAVYPCPRKVKQDYIGFRVVRTLR